MKAAPEHEHSEHSEHDEHVEVVPAETVSEENKTGDETHDAQALEVAEEHSTDQPHEDLPIENNAEEELDDPDDLPPLPEDDDNEDEFGDGEEESGDLDADTLHDRQHDQLPTNEEEMILPAAVSDEREEATEYLDTVFAAEEEEDGEGYEEEPGEDDVEGTGTTYAEEEGVFEGDDEDADAEGSEVSEEVYGFEVPLLDVHDVHVDGSARMSTAASASASASESSHPTVPLETAPENHDLSGSTVDDGVEETGKCLFSMCDGCWCLSTFILDQFRDGQDGLPGDEDGVAEDDEDFSEGASRGCT